MERTPLGQRVKAAREARGWTQERLGELAGFPAGRRGVTVADIERGKVREPRRRRVEALADVLCVPVDWLYGLGPSEVPTGAPKRRAQAVAS